MNYILTLVLLISVFVLFMYLINKDKFTLQKFNKKKTLKRGNEINIVKNNDIASLYFVNINKDINNPGKCSLHIFDMEDDSILKNTQFDLNTSESFYRYDIGLKEFFKPNRKIKIKVHLNREEPITKEFIIDFSKNVDIGTEDVMCHADGSISYGFCDKNERLPTIGDFFSEEQIKNRKDLKKSLKSSKEYNIIII